MIPLQSRASAFPRFRVSVRLLIPALIVFTLATIRPDAVRGQAARLFPDGIMVGDVTETQALIWTRTSLPSTVRIEYGTTAAALHQSTSPVQTTPASDYVAKIDLTGLRPATRYHYRASAEREGQRASTLEGTFVTAPLPAETMSVTFAWGADLSERFKPFRIFSAVQLRRPDYFLFLGDTVYADIDGNARTLDDYRATYRRNRDDEALPRFARSAAVYATWDDHEVANNFDRTHARIPIGRQAFLEYWPIRSDPADLRRLYRSFRFGRLLEIFILDTRQYRSPAFERDTSRKTMLGEAQKEWLKRGLQRSDAVFKIIGSSVPLKYHGPDSWEGYTTERRELTNFIAQHNPRSVVFLTGDVHYAAVLRHREGFVEAIAGPLAMFINNRRPAAVQPETEFSFNASFTFGLVRVTGNPPQLTIEIYDVENRLLHRTTVQP
jgi:alkaline phosphatase D